MNVLFFCGGIRTARLTEDGKLLTQIVVEGNLADGP